MTKICPKFAPALTDNLTGGDDMLAHRDFLACATAAVSQSKKPNFPEDSVCYVAKDFLSGVFTDCRRLFLSPSLPFTRHIGHTTEMRMSS